MSVEAALFSKLSADSTLTTLLGGTAIFEQVPQGNTFPAVVFFETSGVDEYALAARVATSRLFTVKAVTERPADSPSSKTADAIAARIDAVLTDADLTISGATHLSTRRESTIKYRENTAGKVYHHVGGLYRIWST